MKKILFGLSLFAAFSLSSCIQNEPANSECDIEEAYVLASDEEALFFTPNDAVKGRGVVRHVHRVLSARRLYRFRQLQALKINFKLTPGASIIPENGSVQDFAHGSVHYRVTSEDRQWHRDYHVKFALIQPIETDLSFENIRMEANGRYYEWFEKSAHGNDISQWATGNPGYAISRSSAQPDEFPTIPWTQDAVSGQSVKLETCDTGLFRCHGQYAHRGGQLVYRDV